jgi:hypothetical protein
MFEGHRDGPPRVIPAGSAPALAPARPYAGTGPRGVGREARWRMDERPPDLFFVADAPQTWWRLHRVLTLGEPETGRPST